MLTKEECMYWLKHLDDMAYTDLRRQNVAYITLKKLIEEHFYPLAFEFEELKPGMWVYDKKIKEICCIEFIDRIITGQGIIKVVWVEYLKSHVQNHFKREEFEEGRYFPVTKAMEVVINEQ